MFLGMIKVTYFYLKKPFAVGWQESSGDKRHVMLVANIVLKISRSAHPSFPGRRMDVIDASTQCWLTSTWP